MPEPIAPFKSAAPPRRRQWAMHALIAALLIGVSLPPALHLNKAWQTRRKLAGLVSDQPALRQEALGYVYANAGGDPALVRSLAEKLDSMPAETCAEALRLAALSGASETSMNPGVAEAARGVFARLKTDKEKLQLTMALLDAPLRAKKNQRLADTAAYDQALAMQTALLAAEMQPENTVRLVSLFERRAPDHPAIAACLAAYAKRMEAAQGIPLLELAGLLNSCGHWSPETANPALYNRWLATLAGVPGDDTRIYAINMIRTRPRAGDYAELGAVLLRMTADPVPAVRLTALRAAAEWAKEGTQATAFAAAIQAAASDKDESVAREAWIMLGLLSVAPPVPEHLERTPFKVSEAMFVTLVKAHPHDAPLLRQLAAILEQNDAQAASAAHALANTDDPIARDAIFRLLEKKAGPLTRQMAQWRVLSEGSPEQARLFLDRTPGISPLTDAAAFAAKRHPGPAGTSGLADDAAKRHRLAALEGLPQASTSVDMHEEEYGLAYLAAAKAEKDPAKVIAHLRPLLCSGESIWRDEACWLAAQRLTKDQATELARDLLATPGDPPKMSGAMLCGLAKVHPRRIRGGSAPFLLAHPEWTEAKLYALTNDELARLNPPLSTLDALTDNANRWANARTPGETGVLMATRLGLALRGDKPMDAGSLLFERDIPHSTVLLAMLVQKPHDAFDALLGDDVRVPFSRQDLLVKWRYGELLAAFLPADAPRIGGWADLHLQSLQLEQLRAWWRINKLSAKK